MKSYTHPADATGPTYVPTDTGTKLVHPGDSVVVSHGVLDDLHQPAAGVVESPLLDNDLTGDQLSELQGKKVEEIKSELPNLSDRDLEALLMLEQSAPTPRTTLIAAFEAEQLARLAKSDEPPVA